MSGGKHCGHSPAAQREAMEERGRCPCCLWLQVQRLKRELETLRETVGALTAQVRP